MRYKFNNITRSLSIFVILHDHLVYLCNVQMPDNLIKAYTINLYYSLFECPSSDAKRMWTLLLFVELCLFLEQNIKCLFSDYA